MNLEKVEMVEGFIFAMEGNLHALGQEDPPSEGGDHTEYENRNISRGR